MKFLPSSLSGRSRPNAVRPRCSTSRSKSLMLVPPQIEVTGSGFVRSMSGLMGGWSRQLQSTASSLLPFATGAAAYPKTFQRTTIPAASRFCHGAAPDIDMLRSLRSIIDSEPPVVIGIPVGSPFEIFSSPAGSRFETFVKYHQEIGESAVYHYRYNNGETVHVEVEKDVGSESASEFSVCIGKLPECIQFMFCISALEGEIKIRKVAFADMKKRLKCIDNPLDYPPDLRDFSLLDKDSQAAFYKYLAVRGITANWYVENGVLYFR